MKDLLTNFRNYSKTINEVKNRWQFNVLVRLEKDANLYADLFEKIRAIPGVTIVKTVAKQRNISPTQKAAVLEIKCVINNTGMINYKNFLRSRLTKLKDDEGDRILSVSYTTAPEDIS